MGRRIEADLLDLFMAADEAGIWAEMEEHMANRVEEGLPAGGIWIWEMFKALCQQRGLV